MTVGRLTTLQVSGALSGGGAERVALSLHRGLRARGQDAWLAVGRGPADEPGVVAIPLPEPGALERLGRRAAGAVAQPLAGRVPLAARVERAAASPILLSHRLDWLRGREPFDHPGTARIPDLVGRPLDLVHLHNLHGGYFDLRRLPDLARAVPLAMTLHDEWTFTGHCAYTLGCERWRSGCGACPHLDVYPALRRDGTAGNHRRKRAIWAALRLHVSAPSAWLLDRARDSMLAPGAASWRVIPNGVDRTVFTPGDRTAARARLGLPADAAILVFVANRARTNRFKDLGTVVAAAGTAAASPGLADRTVLCLVIGDEGPDERAGSATIRCVGDVADTAVVADHLRASDLVLHAAHADTFPTTVLEALACGVPAVATAVGGVPEQVRSLVGAPGGWAGPGIGPEEATGVLVPPAEPEAMGAAIAALVVDAALRARLGANAAADAASRFDLERQLDDTLDWYRSIVGAGVTAGDQGLSSPASAR